MLARTAQGLYWMSRYLERSQHLCRLLRLQSQALIDRPVREINLGWSRIYGSVGRVPPAGYIESFDSDSYALADSFALAGDATFERSNPESVWSCFALGRENARQMRWSISAEMWGCLNLAYLRIKDLNIEDIWRTSPESFYANLEEDIDKFNGVASNTMYRDEGWHFLRLGQFVERAQLQTSLLITQLELDESGENGDVNIADWMTLLRMYHAVEAYNRRFNVAVEPENVLDVLTTDGLLPVSLARTLDRAGLEISSIGTGPDARASDSTRRLAGRLSSMIHYEWPDREDKKAMLERANELCRDLHRRLSDTYFEYSTEELPRQ